MPLRLDSQSADFSERFRALLAVKRETAQDVEQRVRHIIAEVKAHGDRALLQLTLNSTASIWPRSLCALRPRRSRRRRKLATPSARRAQTRARAYRGLSPAPEADRRALHRRARRRARLALDRDRGGRSLCAGRHRGLSVLGADERGAGQGRRLRAAGHGGAGAGRKAFAVGIGGGQARRRRRDLPHRRRAGGGGARLWHRDDRTRGQDRRARQRLCGGGQAPGVRPGRHRHDRRSVRGADSRRQDRQSRLDRRRPVGAGRARRQRAIDPDHRRRCACRSSREGGRLRSSRRCRARKSPALRGAISARSSWCRSSPTR